MRVLGKYVNPWNKKISIRNKESTNWIIETTVAKERDRIRSITDNIPINNQACERREIRLPPHELLKLKKYIWTIQWMNWDIDFSINNISSWWIQIKPNQPLKLWEIIEISFTLDKNYRFDWKVVWKKWNLYWIQFNVDNNSLQSTIINWKDLANLLSSVEIH